MGIYQCHKRVMGFIRFTVLQLYLSNNIKPLTLRHNFEIVKLESAIINIHTDRMTPSDFYNKRDFGEDIADLTKK